MESRYRGCRYLEANERANARSLGGNNEEIPAILEFE